ncbi:MAG: aminoacyl-tRNA hydrolase [Coriobacteriales bacterium]|nr:aminoacyl-tRNA hydrolase [Coriobacteriales bacterium]
MTRMIVGLGNPGPEYALTRHNAGFLALDLLGENLRATYWKDQGGAKVAVVDVGGEDLVLAKPMTFMNLSGSAVAKLAEAYEVAPDDIIIIHDDIDLQPGSVRVKRGGGHGGHNGLRSIHDKMKTDAYLRVRIGVGRPRGRKDPADWVLEPMRGADLEELEASIPDAAQATMHVLEHGVDSAMQEFNAG